MIKKSFRLPFIILAVILILSAFLLWDLIETGKVVRTGAPGIVLDQKTQISQADYVGKESCIKCHQRQHGLWEGSHHDLAMQKASDSTVLGNFDDEQFTHFGITSKFYRRDNKFFVETESLDGKNHEFEVSFTYGITPLQQYLVEFPDGRLQVLPLCWDTRSLKEGGQKWFHIYPDERIAPDDILFWMRINQNWNFMCSECHSTNVRKNYDVESNTFNTTYSEINTSCEACHGPGSDHVTWAEAYQMSGKPVKKGDMGLKIRLKLADQGTWIFTNSETGTAERNRPLGSKVLVEMCARCHSRRTAITDEYVYGKHLLNTHRPRLLEEDVYYPDGQILEEVYVYDSFLQSKMYQKGVICTDCHEPHSTKVYAYDNTLCYRCHSYEKYGGRSHHFHNPDSTGSLCVECHMPERTYMVIDPRRDHSIRIPRPDLSDKLGTPNACNKCHDDKSAQWSTDYIKKWYGDDSTNKPHFGTVFYASRKLEPGSREALLTIVRNSDQPVMVRASAILELERFPNTEVARIINEMVHSNEPLLRFAAAQSADMIAVDERWAMMKHLLNDSLSVIRLEAANKLSNTNRNRISEKYQRILDREINAYIKSQNFNGERPSSHLNLGILYLQQGNYDLAESEYKKAIELEPGFPYSYINLSDLYRTQNRDDLGEKVLLDGIAYIKKSPDLFQALGFLYVRQRRIEEGMEYLEKSVLAAPQNPDFAYTYGVALNSTGKSQEAIRILEEAYQYNIYNESILQALATISRDSYYLDKSIRYTRELIRLNPANRGYVELLRELQQKRTNEGTH